MTEATTLEITRLGAQGDGIADTPAGPVFVARALPGESVIARIEGQRGELVEVVRAAAGREAPRCPHFGSCGGCSGQHMGDIIYRDWKHEMVRAAFAHRGLEPVIEAVVAVPPGRRRRATFAAEIRSGKAILGFHEEGTHTLTPIAACPVMLPAIETALPALRAVAAAVLGSSQDKARIAVTAASAGLDLMLVDAPDKIDAQTRRRIAEIAGAAGIIRVTAGGHIVMQSAMPQIVLGGAKVELPPGAFIQATAEAETAIAGVLAEATRKAKRIADLFCGLGTFTYELGRRARVLAVDGDKPAIEALIAAAKAAAGVKPVETRLRDLIQEPLSRTELMDLDAVVFDPPRAGAKAQCEMLARAKVPVICAVSCNPATLARDCRILVDAGYAIERVVPIDQFVWSAHVEAVAVLRRAQTAR